MVGRKSLIPSEVIKKEILKHTIHDDLFHLKGKKNKVWKDISNAFKNKIQPASIYIMVKKDRHEIKTLYEQEKSIVFVNIFETVDSPDDLEKKDDSQLGEENIDQCEKNDKEEKNGPDQIVSEVEINSEEVGKVNEKEDEDDILVSPGTQEFQIVFNEMQWNSIKPVIKLDEGGSERKVMQEGWGDAIIEQVWQKAKIPCAFEFNNHRIGKSYFFTSMGFCSECKSTLLVTLVNEPTSTPVHLEAIAEEVKFKVPHYKCRRLAGPAREEIKQQLIDHLPLKWQRTQAKKIMVDGDPHPPQLYNLPSLQKARSDAVHDKLGLKKGLSLFESIHHLKANSRYGHFIHQTGFQPFFCIFYSEAQVKIHNDIITYLDNPTSGDATGSVCISIKNAGSKSKHNFLTILTTYIEKKIVLTFQMLSERNDANIISFGVREFLRDGAKKPRQLVTDMGKGIKNGLCLAFNDVSYKEYKNICLKILKNEIRTHSLNTHMATDIAHFVHVVTKWSNFTKKEPKVQQLYKHCLGVLSTIEELANFEVFFKSVVILAYSEFCNSECTSALKIIIKSIQTFEFDDNIKLKMEKLSKEDQDNVNETIDADEYKRTEEKQCEKVEDDYVKNYIDDLVDSIGLQNLSNNEFSQKNEYHYPEFAGHFIELCYDFPCCTNTLLRIFGIENKIATSSRSENSFRDVKDNVLENRIPIRQDKFIIKLAEQIDSDLMLRRTELNNLIFQIKNEKRKVNKHKKTLNNDYLSESDRWRKHGQIQMSNIASQLQVEQLVDYEEDPNEILPNSTIVNDNENSKSDDEQIFNSTSSSTFSSVLESMTASLPTNVQVSVIKRIGKESSFKINKALPEQKLKKKRLLPTEKKRGFYVSPNADIEFHLQIPRKSKKEIHIIQNGLRKGGSKSVNGIQYYFQYTCAWDSNTELISYAASNSLLFKKFIDTNRNQELAQDYKCYLSTIFTYRTKGLTNSNSIYTSRAYQLLPIAQQLEQVASANYVDCSCNNNNLFHTLMSQYECTIEIQTCTLCGQQNVVKIPVMPLNTSTVKIHNYGNLEEELNNSFGERIFNCQACNGSEWSGVMNRVPGPYIWIDVEDSYKPSLIKSLAKEKEKEISTYLGDLPVYLTIQDENFILCGVVENRPGHFVAYCYNAQYKYWEERNDMNDCAIKYCKNFPNVRINSILYVKWEKNLSN